MSPKTLSPKTLALYRSVFGHAMLGALLLWMALPPWSLWPLAWIAPLWWVMLIRRKDLGVWKARTGRMGANAGTPKSRHLYRVLWLAGFLFWMAAYHWLRLPHWASFFGWIAASFYLGFYLPVFVALSRVAVHRCRVPVILAAPIVWTGLELARAYVVTGITMGDLGHTQYRWITLIQLSDLTGAYGVSFVVMCVAACLARMIPCEDKPGAWWPLAPAAALVGMALVYGYSRTSGDYTAPGGRIALIQGNIDSEVKADEDNQTLVMKHYWDLSLTAVNRHDRIDLLVWPETMFRQSLIELEPDAVMPEVEDLTAEEVRRNVQQNREIGLETIALLANQLDVPLILGIDRLHLTATGQNHFNSAVYVSRSGEVLGRYDKNHRVIFGEYVPFAEYFPWLQRLTPVGGSIDAGEKPVTFELGELRIAPSICYENVLPHVIRRQVIELEEETGRQPNVLVNLTNDGWFYGSSELDMHLICGVFRAVECRKPMVIAANTGFSAWIDGNGEIRQRGRRHDTDILVADVELDRRSSPYLRYGDWPAGVCLAACIILAVVGVVDRLRRTRRCTT